MLRHGSSAGTVSSSRSTVVAATCLLNVRASHGERFPLPKWRGVVASPPRQRRRVAGANPDGDTARRPHPSAESGRRRSRSAEQSRRLAEPMEPGPEGVRRQPAQPGDQLAVGRPAKAHGQTADVRQLQAVFRAGWSEPGLGQRLADRRRSAGRSLLGDQGWYPPASSGAVNVIRPF